MSQKEVAITLLMKAIKENTRLYDKLDNGELNLQAVGRAFYSYHSGEAHQAMKKALEVLRDE